MIPILYDKDETSFSNNGLGRLRDAIEVKVVEERNGVYELDFSYPVNGANFELIDLGCIVGVTHDESEDVQPFDIVSYTKPINGIVDFHCTHISYRQSYMTVIGSNITSLADAFTLLESAEPSNPFSYETDKTSTGYMSAADGKPKTVRSMLGGTEGSILDVYGGEYEWDKFRVILHSSRGEKKNFSVRYGVNMLEYEEEYDLQGTYSSCIPYWTDDINVVVGDRQDSGTTITDRGECVPLDVTDRFESQPTKAQVEAMGLSEMQSRNSTVPTQNIHVEFVRLQDLGYEGLDGLLECSLCDTIDVIFPDYNTTEPFKIVKVTWDVLRDRYESMELGDLSTTLAEALGVGSESTSQASGIVDYGTNYVRWTNGLQICWINESVSMAINSAYGSLYQGTYTWTYPKAFTAAPSVSVGAVKWGTGASWGTLGNTPTSTSVSIRGIDVASRASGTTYISATAIGWWK